MDNVDNIENVRNDGKYLRWDTIDPEGNLVPSFALCRVLNYRNETTIFKTAKEIAKRGDYPRDQTDLMIEVTLGKIVGYSHSINFNKSSPS